MIPLRIQLKGFLCYKDEQEVLLDGSTLWMMAGLNGSGKSAIFDGMTFALFGHHRGGGQQVVELINHDSDRLNVEFDFALDGDTYRIRRTAIRQPKTNTARTTQGILKRTESSVPGDPPTWEAVENTSKREEFNDWIHDHIGLNYKTFTSSVLLLQGKAERLLEADAAGRFEVLAGIVDLDRYRRLHEIADTRRKNLKSDVVALHAQLEGLPQITDEELKTADDRLRESEARIAEGQAEVSRLANLELQARQWQELQNKRATMEDRWRLAQSTLGEAAAIQKDLDRLRELNDVLPIMTGALDKKTQVRNAIARIEKWTVDERSLSEKLSTCDHAIELAKQKQNTLVKRRDEDEAKHRDVQQQLRQLAQIVSKVQLCEQQRETLKRQQAELETLPGDLETRLGKLKDEIERLAELERSLPLLARLVQQRKELRQVRESEANLGREEKTRLAQGDQLRKKQETRKAEVEAVSRLRQEADGKAVEAKTLFERARMSLREFQSLEGSRICRACGQPLTEGHYKDEKRKRDRELAEAKVLSEKADQVQKKAQGEETKVKRELTACEEELTTARDEYRNWKRDLDQARRDVERLTRETAQAVADLPAFYRERAGGAGVDGEPAFPSESDVASLRQQAAGLETARKELRETESMFTRLQKLRVQVESTREQLQRIEIDLPGDVGALRRKHISMESQESNLANSLKATRQEERDTSDELQRLNRERGDLHQKRTDVNGQLKTEDAQKKLNLDEIERQRAKLPASWQGQLDSAAMAEIHRWSSERQQLVQADTEGKAQRLHQARITLESLKEQREQVEAECNRFPVEARLQTVDVQQQMECGRAALSGYESALREAQRHRTILDSKRQQRDAVEKQKLEKDGELNRYALLSDLLGRTHLQRHLVRQAERQVVDHANAVLDRLSGGQLYLRLRGGEDADSAADKALELEAFNRVTATTPINVAFLSGSQRFRVAVSLALGLGQYASRQHRPIESVIIDEGFGCLDRQGRQVMIQELQNLRGQLRCILLVSHQEEFADAFSDGYLFELENGATRVKRFQR
jgi:DNA repair exonuclease SbcCD ATPase subunit